MRRIEGGYCLEDLAKLLVNELKKSPSNLSDGIVETEEFFCGRTGCIRNCVIRGKIENSEVVEAYPIYSGGNCVERA